MQEILTWKEGDEKAKAAALAASNKALESVRPIVRSRGSNVFYNVSTPSTSVRDDFTRKDYDYFRKDQRLPEKPDEVISACIGAYKRIGIVKNVIDLMADFGSRGVQLRHPNERIERFYRDWFRRVRGKDRSERFLSMLYKTGNVVVSRRTFKVPARVEDEMRRSKAEPDIGSDDRVKAPKRELPWRYTIRSPLSVEVLSEELAAFVGDDRFLFAVKIPRSLASKIKKPKSEEDKAYVSRLPEPIVNAVRRGALAVPLEPDKTRAFYYKKDDDEVWALPMVHAVLSDLQVYEKMKLADMAALDGVISCIRVWKLGSLEHRIPAQPSVLNRLSEMLTANVGGGVMDLVWGPDLELMETSTDVHHFLGSTKYEPVLQAIFAGLGVPPTLTGTQKDSGFTNNAISLKTLIDRLQYGRDILTEFWEEEIRLVQQAMGFRFPATLTFEHMSLTDEATRLKLLLDLLDRDLVGPEFVLDAFGAVPEIEEIKARRAHRRREEGLAPPKASPFHSPMTDHQKEMAFISQGTVTPSEVGLELDEKKDGEKSLVDRNYEQATKDAKLQMKGQQQQLDHQFRTEKLQLKHGAHPNQIQKDPPGQSGEGRPKLSNDKVKRKQKTVTPRTKAEFARAYAWAEDALASVSAMTSPALLKSLGKKSLRELTDDEARDYEDYKFRVLLKLQPGTLADRETVKSVASGDLSADPGPLALVREMSAKYTEEHGKPPPVETARRYQALAYALWTAA